MGLSKESQEPAIKMAGHDHITQAGLDAVKLLVSSQNGSGSESVGIKHVGLSFEALSLSVPQTDVSTTKTLPRAILNTFGVDQFNFLLKCLRSSGVVSDTTETSNLLTNFTGLVKPGEMLLVLGQPGSGCSTFLRTAANQSTLTLSGDLRFANIPANEFRKLHRRETIYLPEEDRHIAALTVRQTIEFALRMSLPKRIRKPELIEEMVLTMSRMFGIEHTLGTPVGGPFFPGISGGERKRVSIAEVLAAGSSVQCFDNSTTGLDSATALDFVKALRTLTDVAQRTTLATLYQAGENIYKHFDKVLLIDRGHQAFFGATGEAKAYFEQLGFISESGQTTAEFLTMVTDPRQRKARPGSQAASIRTPQDLANAFKCSTKFASLEHEIADYTQVEQEEAMLIPTSSYNLSLPFQIWECLKREVHLVSGQRRVHYTKWITTVILSLVVGSEYFDVSTGAQGAFTRAGIIFYALIFNGWMQFPELFDAHTNRPVLERQASLNLYRPSSLALARVLIDIPLVFVQHVWFMLSFYFLAGLQIDAGKFFFFFLTLLISTIDFSNLLRMFAYYVSSLDDCFRYGGSASTITIFVAGFLIPVNDMRPYFGWLHYVSPIKYAFESLFVSEFDGRSISCNGAVIPGIPDADPDYQVCTVRGAQPGQMSVPGLQYAQAFDHHYDRRWRNIGIMIALGVGYIIASVVGSEIMRFTPQGGSPIVYAKRKEKRTQNPSLAVDVEKKAPIVSSSSQSSLAPRAHHSGPSLAWKDLTVDIDGKMILNGIMGYVRPGDFIALCGASGAGKTTMLNALSQTNLAGQLGGEVSFGGRPPGEWFKNMRGFAQQQDLHDATATIREAFEFSALLRQPSVYSRSEKLAYVDEVLDVLDLTHFQHALIGEAGSGLGVEMTKRVTIGVELSARPKILFADEPTSGLDSQGAAATVRYLRRLAQGGQAVLVTIHQPSASLFASFDKLLALSSEGEQLYFGPVDAVVPYFERHGAVPPEGANPAEFVLETVGAGIHARTEGKGGEWSQRWKLSPEADATINELTNIAEHSSGEIGDGAYSSAFNASIVTQTYQLTQRILRSQWRNTPYIYSKIWVHVIQALLIGLTFYQLGTSPQELQNRAFSVFTIMFLVNTIVNTILARFFFARLTWEIREGPSQAYGWIALCSASTLAEIPAALICGVMYYLIWYFLSGLPLGEPAGYIFLSVLTYEIFEVLFGMFMMAMSPDLGFAGNILVFLVCVCNWFNGIVVPYSQIQTFWRYWLYYINPFTYLFGGMVKAVIQDQAVVCDDRDLYRFSPPPGQTCGSYASDWATSASAQLLNPSAIENCSVCQWTSGNQYLEQLNLGSSMLGNNIWAYWGVFVLFTISNLFLVYFLTWATRVKRWKLFYFF